MFVSYIVQDVWLKPLRFKGYCFLNWYPSAGCTVLYAFVRVRVLCPSGGCTVLYAFVRVRVLCPSGGCTVLYAFVRVRLLFFSVGCTVLYACVRVRVLCLISGGFTLLYGFCVLVEDVRFCTLLYGYGCCV